MHAAVPQGGDRLAGQAASPFLIVTEFVSRISGFFDQEQTQSAVAERRVPARARQHHEQFRPPGESTPGLAAVEQPAAFDPARRQRYRGYVRPGIRFGNRNGAKFLARGERWQPFTLLRFRSARQQRPGGDFRPRNQAARGAERTAGKFFGHHDHGQAVGAVVGLQAAESLRNACAETAESGSGLDQAFRYVEILPVDLFRLGFHHFVGETLETAAYDFDFFRQRGRQPDSLLLADRPAENLPALGGQVCVQIIAYVFALGQSRQAAGAEPHLRGANAEPLNQSVVGFRGKTERDPLHQFIVGPLPRVLEHGPGGAQFRRR